MRHFEFVMTCSCLGLLFAGLWLSWVVGFFLRDDGEREEK